MVATGLSDVLEADAKHIAKMARETFEKYASFFFFHFSRIFFYDFLLNGD